MWRPRLGAMMFGDWGTKDHDESVRIIHRALDAGINFIDAADVYSAGESEVIVSKALAGGRRDDIVLASKVHMPMVHRYDLDETLGALSDLVRAGKVRYAGEPAQAQGRRAAVPGAPARRTPRWGP